MGSLGLTAGKDKKTWMSSDLFLAALEHFIKHVHSTKEAPTLLITDNSSSHIAIEVICLARETDVTILTLPPHTTHRTQSLDVKIFSPFNKYFYQAIRLWFIQNPSH